MASRVALRSALASNRLALAPRSAPVQRRTFLKGFFGSASVPVKPTDPSVPAEGFLQGPGAKLGSVPTDLDQATGTERYELLGNMAGIDVFDMKPVLVDRMGTMADPIPVHAIIDERLVGCTGYPVDSHDLLWYSLKGEEIARCAECGCCYQLKYHNPWSEVIPEIAEQQKNAKLLPHPSHAHHHGEGEHKH
ncbi:Cytochrome c oxidase, subunit Vb/COX4 [Phaffia rhodozyma]|uniref:Cytochrome c oxidase, subunit Vb/COX4 n=1 Tax=Phaffia rhodozyma TaxID=264483 RepID=A0A0F7SPJ0_PHARH|nr:Cytochrome c oxidase, subunit Vb/COX4 [Phaffia rhodozyma]